MKYFAGRNVIIEMGLGFSLAYRDSVLQAPNNPFGGKNATISPNFTRPSSVALTDLHG